MPQTISLGSPCTQNGLTRKRNLRFPLVLKYQSFRSLENHDWISLPSNFHATSQGTGQEMWPACTCNFQQQGSLPQLEGIIRCVYFWWRIAFPLQIFSPAKNLLYVKAMYGCTNPILICWEKSSSSQLGHASLRFLSRLKVSWSCYILTIRYNFILIKFYGSESNVDWID